MEWYGMEWLHERNNQWINELEDRKRAQRPTGNPSPAPTHPHRTHDTTDQCRDRRWWLGRFSKNVWRSDSPRPTSIGFISGVCIVLLLKVELKVSSSMLSSRNASNYNGFVDMKRDEVWRIGSVLVHVSQLSSSRVRWTWRIGSVLVHVSQLTCFRMRLIRRIGSFLVHVS